MAEYLSSHSCGIRFSTSLCGMLFFAGVALAQELPDPTKPPTTLRPGHDTNSTSHQIAEPTLQSIIISPTRRVAIIAGQTLKQGDKFGNAVVVKITETAVVLRNGTELRTLRLFPDIEKQSLPRPGEQNKVEVRGNKGKS